nr:hypothetical protein CFP56_72897 [Quercus suber]
MDVSSGISSCGQPNHGSSEDMDMHCEKGDAETIVHYLRDCPLAKSFWNSFNPPIHPNLFYGTNVLNWLRINCQCTRKCGVSEVDWATITAIISNQNPHKSTKINLIAATNQHHQKKSLIDHHHHRSSPRSTLPRSSIIADHRPRHAHGSSPIITAIDLATLIAEIDLATLIAEIDLATLIDHHRSSPRSTSPRLSIIDLATL